MLQLLCGFVRAVSTSTSANTLKFDGWASGGQSLITFTLSWALKRGFWVIHWPCGSLESNLQSEINTEWVFIWFWNLWLLSEECRTEPSLENCFWDRLIVWRMSNDVNEIHNEFLSIGRNIESYIHILFLC